MSQKVQRLHFSLWEFGVLALGKWGAALLWMELVPPPNSSFPYPAWWAFGGFSLDRTEEYFALIKLQTRAVDVAHLQSIV